MSAAYFKNIPITKYNGIYVRNLILRARFARTVLSNYSAFYPHIVLDGQTPETIAHDYYGDCDLDWLVFFSNDIVDPYYEWVMSEENFNNYLIKKYGTFENALETIHHYAFDESVEDDDPNKFYTADYQMTPETYSFMSTIEKSYWRPVYCYDHEFKLNEAKRSIQLIDNGLKDQVIRELAEVMK